MYGQVKMPDPQVFKRCFSTQSHQTSAPTVSHPQEAGNLSLGWGRWYVKVKKKIKAKKANGNNIQAYHENLQ